jgi:hypothetical protein
MRPVTHDQFQLEGDTLTHVPTGAQFWLGQNNVVSAGMGKAGQSHAREVYDPEELRKAACEILESERTDCV